MQLKIILEPPGAEAGAVLQEWLTASGLQVAVDGLIDVHPDICLEVLVALRSLCYERGLTVNVKLSGKED